jgi:hypothetical protein
VIDGLAYWFMGIAASIGGLNLLLGLFGMKLKTASIVATAVVELVVVAQLVVTIVVLAGGGAPKGALIEFFGYVLVALFVPIAGVFLALIEKTKNATIILGIAGLTISIMLLRMLTIWNG